MKKFTDLSRLTQRKKLKELGKAALARYNIKNSDLRFISDTSNVIFRVDTPNQRYVLRIDPEPIQPNFKMRIETELCWLLALRQDTELEIPIPVQTGEGHLVIAVSTAAIPNGRYVSLLKWIDGNLIGERPTLKSLRQLGTFMAKLHNHADHFKLPDHLNAPITNWDKLNYWHDPNSDISKNLTPYQQELCAAASFKLLDEIKQISTAENYGLIHADLNLYNCLKHQGELKIIDFGDCRIDSYFYDFAVPLTYLDELDNYDALYAALCEGYNRIRPLTPEHLKTVETFIFARALDMIEWAHFDWPSLNHFPWGADFVAKYTHNIKQFMS